MYIELGIAHFHLFWRYPEILSLWLSSGNAIDIDLYNQYSKKMFE